MIRENHKYHRCSSILQGCRILLLALLLPAAAAAQAEKVIADLSGIDGVALSPANILQYRILNQGSQPLRATLRGSLQYRRQRLSLSYTAPIVLQPGVNTISRELISPSWTFSDNGLRELFFDYSTLPQGTYQYCVSVSIQQPGESTAEPSEACLYYTSPDVFLINLVDPEDDARLHETHPMLSWMVNYRFASELSYRIRVAELRQGQNPQSAISRNNPVYQDDHISSTGTIYPLSAKPLEKYQPYVWTVDAYYKGILLGGSEVWKFTIVDDSELAEQPYEQSYYEFEQHRSDTRLQAIGSLKLKYHSELMTDTLLLQLYNSSKEALHLPAGSRRIPLQAGDNRIDIELRNSHLAHGKNYELVIMTTTGKSYHLPFTYANPLYIKTGGQQ